MSARFGLSGTLLRPGAPGLAALVSALRDGSAIHAAGDDVIARPGTQWLTCQTSGTSGEPRVIRRSPASWIASFEVNAALFGLTGRDTVATLGAIGHSLSLYAAVEALHMGLSLLPLGGVLPGAQVRALARASVLYATPVQARLVVQAARGRTLPGLRLVLIGGGALDPGLAAGLAALAPGADIRAFFGASETSFVTLTDSDTPPGSVGRAYPGVSLRIDPDGEIAVASPFLFDGYETGASPDTRREGGYLRFGELGVLDSTGNLTLTGRKSRRVRIAEQWVSPEAVEAVLSELVPGCAVLPAPDRRRGVHLVAVIQGRADDEARLRTACRALPPQARPRRYLFLPALPMLPAGKPDLAALAEMLA